MPKRLCSDCSQRLCKRCCERVCKRCCERVGCSKEGNLYLVLDDWISGYSIRRINLPASSDGGAVQRLPPALLRMVADRGLPQYFTAAFGAKILMMLAADTNISFDVPLIDVNELDATLGPDMTCSSNPIYIPVGTDKLFVIDICHFRVCCLLPQPDAIFPSLTRDHWVWRELQMTPFKWSYDVSSYAVDNREQTIFVSSKVDTDATFIFDIGKSIWKHYGRWVLPFNGRGYYVRDLDGLVGISTDPDNLGYLYICDMTKTSTGEGLYPYPDVKRSKVKVFNKNPAEHLLGATLTYMHHSKFCIVECVSLGTLKADQAQQELIGVEASSGSSYVYRVITFSIGYNKRAHLKVKNYRVSCYDVPHEATSRFINANPVAFWL